MIAAAPHAEATVGVPTTYEDFSYAGAVKTPSENKPQSKLWFTDGSWWALMVSAGSNDVHIFRLMPDHTWDDTGTVVDSVLNSTGDALWTPPDHKLTVVSRDDDNDARVTRFTYDSASDHYSRDSGFPVSVDTGGGSESAAIDRDSTGRLWITYTRRSKLWVAHSDTNGLNWTAGYHPDVPDVAIKSDDISSVIAFGGKIGVMWSDQASHAFRFAIHRDGDDDQIWSVENALQGANLADDHINLKQVTDDPQGRIFAAIKTSMDAQGPGATLVGVLVRKPRADGTGEWSLVPAGTVADDHTRPIIQIDETNQELYFFATAPVRGGDIYYKKTSLANPHFATGRGDKFVDAKPVVNNASGSKAAVTAETGMVILSVAEGKKKYVHAEMQLAGGGQPPPQDTQKPTPPLNLGGTTSTGQVALSWTAATDNIGVTGYVVKRGSRTVASISQSQLSFTDNGVVAGSTYSYTVSATDAAGNVSDPSNSVTVTVPDGPAPTGGIRLRDSTTTRNTGAHTLGLAVPSSQAGDLLLATIDYRGRGTISTPAGWALLRQDVNGKAMQKATFWRVASAGEPASYTWNLSGKPTAVAAMLAYSGVTTSSPIQASSGDTTAKSRNITAPSAPATAGSVVVGLFGLARSATIDNPSGTTELTEISSASGIPYPMTGETTSETWVTAGATGARVAHASVSGPSIGQLIVLNAATLPTQGSQEWR